MSGYTVTCTDGAVRHPRRFPTWGEAAEFSDWGHCCTAYGHTIKPTPPVVHVFETTADAYDESQCRDDIHDGDVLYVPAENVIGVLVEAWPIAITPEAGVFHVFNHGVNLRNHDTDYDASATLAESLLELQPGVTLFALLLSWTLDRVFAEWHDLHHMGTNGVAGELQHVPACAVDRPAFDAWVLSTCAWEDGGFLRPSLSDPRRRMLFGNFWTI